MRKFINMFKKVSNTKDWDMILENHDMGINISIETIMDEIIDVLSKELISGVSFEPFDVYINYNKDAVNRTYEFSIARRSGNFTNRYNTPSFSNYTKKFTSENNPSGKAIFINAKDLYDSVNFDISDDTFIRNFIRIILSSIKLIGSEMLVDSIQPYIVAELTDIVFDNLNK